MTPLMAGQALDTCFLEARSKLLGLAANFDRTGRGTDAAGVMQDPRLEKNRRALVAIHHPNGSRAERIQQIFSLDHDPSWERPQPR